MKRFFALLILSAVLLSCFACGSKDPSDAYKRANDRAKEAFSDLERNQ